MFKEGNKEGKGRPLGSPNKVNKEHVFKLVNMTITDLENNFEKMNINQKLRLLHTFRGVIESATNEIDYKQNLCFKILNIDPLSDAG